MGEKNTEDLKRAMELEKALSEIRNPQKPERNIIQRKKPPIERLKSNKVLAFGPFIVCLVLELLFMRIRVLARIFNVAGFFAFWWIPYYYLGYLKKQRQEYVEQVQNSEEYKKQCAEYEQKYDKMQTEQDAVYQREFSEYLRTVNENQRKVDAIQAELYEIYTRLGEIPVQYRNVQAMTDIYRTISSSNYSIKDAINLYENKLQRQAEEERLRRQREMEEMEWERKNRESSSGSDFVRDTASTAAGTWVGTRGIKKELNKQTEYMKQEAEAQERERRRQEIERRHREDQERMDRERERKREMEQKKKEWQEKYGHHRH